MHSAAADNEIAKIPQRLPGKKHIGLAPDINVI